MPSGTFAADPNAPTLDLDFTRPGVLPSGPTFTRASTATYFDINGVMQTAAANAPRWDYDPATHYLRGLLLEDASSNQLFSSTITSAGGWSSGAISLILASGIAPDGTNTMTKLSEAATTAIHGTGQTLKTITAASTYTLSVYAKAAENRYLQPVIDDNSATGVTVNFDLVTGTISLPASAQGTAVLKGASIQPVGNGIYRCSLSLVTSTTSTTLRYVFNMQILPTAGKFATYAGVAGNGLLLWGAQLEPLAYPTSFIPTTTAVVSRAIDACNLSAANVASWFTGPGGSWYCEFDSFPTSPTNNRILGRPNFPGGVSPASVGVAPNNYIGQYDGAGGVSGPTPTTPNTVIKAASTWTAGEAKQCTNGGAVAKSAALVNGYGIYTTGGIQLMPLGSAGGGDNNSGHMRQLRYWPRVLSDLELQDFTSPSLDLSLMVPGRLPSTLTFSRASVATYFDATGTMQSAANDTPRWDYDPSANTLNGILFEESRTNSAMNSTMVGAVSGTPGTWPTNWGLGGSPALSTQIVGTGVESGIPYIDIRVFGTSVGSGSTQIVIQGGSPLAVAANAQTWTKSAYLRLVAGALTNISSITFLINETTSAGVGIRNDTGPAITVTSAPLGTQRSAYVFTLTGGATVGGVVSRLNIVVTAGLAADATLRLGAPQLELGGGQTSFISTSTVAVTRSADVCTAPTNPSWFNAAASSLVADYMVPQARNPSPTVSRSPTGLNDGTASNRLVLYGQVNNNSNQARILAGISGTQTGSAFFGATLANVVMKVGGAWDGATAIGAINGNVAVSLALGVPAGLNSLVLGSEGVGLASGDLNGWLQRVRYWSRALSASDMQVATGGMPVQARAMVMA